MKWFWLITAAVIVGGIVLMWLHGLLRREAQQTMQVKWKARRQIGFNPEPQKIAA